MTIIASKSPQYALETLIEQVDVQLCDVAQARDLLRFLIDAFDGNMETLKTLNWDLYRDMTAFKEMNFAAWVLSKELKTLTENYQALRVHLLTDPRLSHD